MRNAIAKFRRWLAAEGTQLRRREAEAIHALETAAFPKMERTVDRVGMIGLLTLGLIAAAAMLIAPNLD